VYLGFNFYFLLLVWTNSTNLSVQMDLQLGPHIQQNLELFSPLFNLKFFLDFFLIPLQIPRIVWLVTLFAAVSGGRGFDLDSHRVYFVVQFGNLFLHYSDVENRHRNTGSTVGEMAITRVHWCSSVLSLYFREIIIVVGSVGIERIRASAIFLGFWDGECA